MFLSAWRKLARSGRSLSTTTTMRLFGGRHPVEIASALARLVRMKHLDSGEWATSRRLAMDLADQWAVIRPSDSLRARAAQLVNRYDLSAADALQLAAALEWCGDLPQGQVFLAADQRLRDAALLSGFAAEQL